MNTEYNEEAVIIGAGSEHWLGRLAAQLARCVFRTLQIWELLAIIITQALTEYINHSACIGQSGSESLGSASGSEQASVMRDEKRSSIPVTIKRRQTAELVVVPTSTEVKRVMDQPMLTPSTQPGSMIAMQMPQPGMGGAPCFSGQNVSDFLSEFDSLCDDAQFSEAARAARVHRYCVPEISRYLKGIPEWEEQDWSGLKSVMQKEWEGYDDYQHTRTLAFLEVLKNQDREKSATSQIRQYCRQFKQSVIYLKKAEQISEYQASTWFLQGLKRTMASQVVRDLKIDMDKPSDMKFNDMYDCALRLCDYAEKFARVYRPQNREAMEELVQKAPTVPIVKNPSTNEIWRPATLQVGASDERLINRDDGQRQHDQAKQGPSQAANPQKEEAYLANVFDKMADKMAKLSIRNIRAEIRAEMEREATKGQATANGQPFSSPGLGNRASSTNRDPSREPPRFSDTQRTVTCYFCEDAGHFRNECPQYLQMQKDGKVHENADRRLCVGPEEEHGEEIRFRRGQGSQKEQAQSQYEDYVRRMQARSDQQATRVHSARVGSVRIGMVGLRQSNSDIKNDTEYESSDYDSGHHDHIGVAASRAVTRSLKKSGGQTDGPDQGPRLDKARRVIKNRQEKEANLPAPKNARFGKYRQPAAIDSDDPQEDIAMEVDEADIEEEIIPPTRIVAPEPIPQSHSLFSVPNQTSVIKDTTNETAKEAMPRAKAPAPGKRLVTALNADKFSGARSLVKSMMDSKVEVTIGNLLAGSGEARKLLFTVREWESNDTGLNNGATRIPLRVSTARMPLISSIRSADKERSFFTPCP